MPSNPLLHFITKVINLEDVKVINYHFLTDDEIVIEIENKLKVAKCPHCGNTSDKIHQNHWYRVRDIPLSDYQVLLKVNRRQLKCKKCHQVFSEELDFIKARRTYTKRLAMKVIKEVLETNVESAARRNRMTTSEVETLLKELEVDLLAEKPKKLKKLGIDEITQLKGGKNYAAVLVDLETRKPIALLEKRNKAVIAEYISSLGLEVLSQIEEVSIDLWIPYKSLIQEMMPNAQIVADRFHVMKQINEELDQKRKKEKRAAEKIKNKKERENILAGLTQSKYPLLKKKENLNSEEKAKIESVEKVAPELGKMYRIKEGIRDIFDSPITSDEALYKFLEWTETAYKYFPKSCRTISRWIDEILAYFDSRTTQGIVEGINQKIKLIKRRAYGLTNFDNFRRRILLNWYFCY
ncbi:ISL3 family transposase [Nostoc sp. 106C]|uniref:ISL3 family transposase n=1 Tax=Nostoc sp. 106C TaxID=1932667 RepID=UPI000A36ED7F|nr:ISL3 family transposase [Nostoc sp. 106C]OUL23409.1 ISL3 family transposase [Nostoc sp. 106C]